MSVPGSVMMALEVSAAASDLAPAAGKEKKKRQVWRACLPCRKLKLSCDAERPCSRCTNRGITAECTTWDEGARRACVPCQKSKFKCDRGRPCSRCLKRGTCEECIDWQEELRLVREAGGWKGADGAAEARSRVALVKPLNPVSFRSKHIVFQNEMTAMCSTCLKSRDLVHMILHRYADFGHNLENLLSMFARLPPSTQQLLEEIAELSVKSQRRLIAHRTAAACAETRKSPVPLPSSSSSGDEPTEDEEIEMWDDHDEVGYLRINLDQKTMKKSSLYLNKRFAKFHGVHQEELLARMANNDAIPLASEFDIVKNIFLDLTQGFEGRTHYTKFMQCTPDHGGRMIRVDVQLITTTKGLVSKLILFWTIVDPLDVQIDPSEIVEFGEQGQTIATLLSSPYGQRRVRDFEACIQRRMARLAHLHPDVKADLEGTTTQRPAKRRMLSTTDYLTDSFSHHSSSDGCFHSMHFGRTNHGHGSVHSAASSTDGSRGHSPGFPELCSSAVRDSPPRLEELHDGASNPVLPVIKQEPREFNPAEKLQQHSTSGSQEWRPSAQVPVLRGEVPIDTKEWSMPLVNNQERWWPASASQSLQFETRASANDSSGRHTQAGLAISGGDFLNHVPFEEKPICDEIAISMIQAGW